MPVSTAAIPQYNKNRDLPLIGGTQSLNEDILFYEEDTCHIAYGCGSDGHGTGETSQPRSDTHAAGGDPLAGGQVVCAGQGQGEGTAR